MDSKNNFPRSKRCKKCNTKTKTSDALHNHIRNIHTRYPFPCPYHGCGTSFVFSYQLIHHLAGIHSQRSKVCKNSNVQPRCNVCGIDCKELSEEKFIFYNSPERYELRLMGAIL